MAWNAPTTLQDRAAGALVRRIIDFVEDRVHYAMDTVPAELLIARATAALIHDRDEYDDDSDEEYDSDSKSSDEVDVMDIAITLVKAAVDEVRHWLSMFPKSRSGPRIALEEACDVYTEVHPKYDKNFPRHLACMLMKLLVLESMFIDRDYGDKDKRCVIPFAWEQWVAKLMQRLGPFPHIHNMQVYGGMYPNILSAIMRQTPNLKSLSISHINITDEILQAVSRYCPKLEKLYILHNYPWQVISMRAFCAAFFKGATHKEAMEGFISNRAPVVKKSFPALKEVELAYGKIAVIRDFHRLLLFHYPELRRLSCEWKTNVFDDHYSSHSHEVIFPVIRRGKQRLSITKIFLICGNLHTMGPDQLHNLAWVCPDVSSLTLGCVNKETQDVYETEGLRLLEVVLAWPHLLDLHLNLNVEHNLIKAYLTPTLSSIGQSLKSLTLEGTSVITCLSTTTLSYILEHCPNITSLKVRAWSRNSITLTEGNAVRFPKCKHLEELYFHEDGPGDSTSVGDVSTREEECWVAVLEALIAAAPRLQTLSFSICKELSSLLDKLSCNIQVLHLHVKSCHEWNPPVDRVQSLVSRLPNLQHLYLEEIRGNVYWRIWRCFRYTGLKLHWGNLYGWPRT